MTAKKKMNKSERKIRSDVKKDMQKKGLVPPDKPRLNRKKYWIVNTFSDKFF